MKYKEIHIQKLEFKSDWSFLCHLCCFFQVDSSDAIYVSDEVEAKNYFCHY